MGRGSPRTQAGILAGAGRTYKPSRSRNGIAQARKKEAGASLEDPGGPGTSSWTWRRPEPDAAQGKPARNFKQCVRCVTQVFDLRYRVATHGRRAPPPPP